MPKQCPNNPFAFFCRRVFASQQGMIPLIGPFFWKRRSLYSELEADERRDALPAEQIAEVMEPIYLRGDRILTVLLLAHAALAVTLAFVYGTWLIALAVGGIALALFLPAAAFLPGRLLTRCLAGISLQAFVLLHIYQMHGLAEMHFLFFAACTIMIVYQDWRCLWPGTLLFALLAQAGRPFHLLGDDISAVKLCVHVGIVALQTGVCGHWASLMRRRTLAEVRQARDRARHDQLLGSLAEAEGRADTDPLTELLNHRAFHRRLSEEADRSQREGTSLAVAVFDLNNFKFFNEAYGHLAGDAVLLQVASALRGACRSYDSLARYGGDEFTLIAPGIGPDTIHAFSERLRRRLEGVCYQPEVDGNVIPLLVSFGVALFPQDGPTRLHALDVADQRLARMKSGAEDEDDEVDHHRAALSASLEGFSMLDALVTAVDNKDRYTLRHSEDVLKYSLQVARGLGLDAETQQTLKTAALLHDVGKIGVPDFVLRKPDKLTEEESKAIRHHPMMGAIIVGAVPGMEDTLDAIRHHHERWDGGGYPFGLRGEETPLIARIMAVADAFSAMTTDRPYRRGMPAERAEAILRDGAGTQWDARCVAAFLSERGAKPAPAAASPSAASL